MAHILLPTDFSDNALHACAYAGGLFGAEDNVYTLMHAYIDAAPSISTWPGMADELYKSSVAGMGTLAERARALPELAGAVVRAGVIYGILTDVLNEVA